MIRRILTIITASFLLATPCLNAGFAEWISGILPEPMRVSEKNRNHFNTAKTIMGIERPAIIMNATLPEGIAGLTNNIGLCSLVRINEYTTDEHDLIEVIYHETGHTYHNHHAGPNALAITGKTLYPMAFFAYARGAMRHTKIFGSAYLLALATHMYLEPRSEEEALQQMRIHEHEAQAKGVEAMAQAGHTDLLQARLQTLQEQAQNERGDARDRGEGYWTVNEEIAMIKAALHKN